MKLLVSIFLLATLGIGFGARAQTNLLLNPNADDHSEHWRGFGPAVVEEFEGNNVFALRGGYVLNHFVQYVKVSESDVGKFALLIGYGSSERINPDGSITGLPSLYGYMLSVNTPKGGVINEYLQGQQMLGRPRSPNEWTLMYGIFRVPEKTVAIEFILQQAERKDDPQTGSAARFDDLGLYIFDTEQDALKYARAYKRK